MHASAVFISTTIPPPPTVGASAVPSFVTTVVTSRSLTVVGSAVIQQFLQPGFLQRRTLFV